MSINLGTSADCRAKDKAKCPYHGVILSMEKAAQAGDAEAYIIARQEAISQYRARESALAKKGKLDSDDLTISAERRAVLKARAEELKSESAYGGAGEYIDISLRHKDEDAAENRAATQREVNGVKHEMQQFLADNGNKAEFEALFDTEGNLIPAKKIETRFGMAWALLDPSDEDGSGSFVSFFSASKAKNAAQREINDRRKGYYVGTVKAPARVIDVPAGNAAYTGVHIPKFVRSDKGFSRDVEIVDNGRPKTAD